MTKKQRPIQLSLISLAVLSLFTIASPAFATCTISGVTATCDTATASFPTTAGITTTGSVLPVLTLTNGFSGSYASSVYNSYYGNNTTWGSIINNGTIGSSVTSGYAFTFNQPTFVNNGTITGGSYGVINYSATPSWYTGSNTFTNTGTITNTNWSSQGGAAAFAVVLSSTQNGGQSFSNSGTITGDIGLSLQNSTVISTFNNTGTMGSILAQGGGPGMTNTIQTLTNSGTIGTISVPVTTLNNQASGTIVAYQPGSAVTSTINNDGSLTTINASYAGLTVNNNGSVHTLNLSSSVAWAGALPATINLIATGSGGYPATSYAWNSMLNLGAASLSSLTGTTIRLGSMNGINTTGTTVVPFIQSTGALSLSSALTGSQTVSSCVYSMGPPTCTSVPLTYTTSTTTSNGVNYLNMVYSVGSNSSSSNSNGPSSSSLGSPTIPDSMAVAHLFASAYAPTAFQTYYSSLTSTADQYRAARQVLPTTASAGSSSSGKSSVNASAMIFDKAGTFNGDLSSMRSVQTRFTTPDTGTFGRIDSSVDFFKLAQNLTVTPMNIGISARTNNSFMDGADPLNYETFKQGQISAWVQGNYTYDKSDTLNNATGSKTQSGTVVTAIEGAISEDLLIGATYSFTKSSSVMDENAGNVTNNQNTLGLYLQKLVGNTKYSAIASSGFNNYNSTRNINMSDTIVGTASAQYGGRTDQILFGMSQQFLSNSTILEPFATVAYIRNNTDAFTESGASGYNLSVSSTTAQDAQFTVGTVFGQQMTTLGKDTIFKIKPAVRYNAQIQSADSNVAFYGNNSSLTNVAGRLTNGLSALMGGELDVKLAKNKIIKFGLDGELSATNLYGKAFMQFENKF